MPSLAALPVPTIIAVGVASPSAHGHAITSTLTAEINAWRKSPPNTICPTKVAAAITRTLGTNTPETLSTTLCTGAFLFVASSTMLIIFERPVSDGFFKTLTVIEPLPLIVPAKTPSPSPLSTGIGSPVSIDSSIEVSPVIITPSHDTLSPGLMRQMSSIFKSSAGIST